MSWIGVWLGLSVPTVEVAQQVGFTVLFPITFISNVFVPTADPARLAPADRRVEPGEHADRRRSDSSGATRTRIVDRRASRSQQPVLVTLVWVVVIVAVFAPLGVRRYRHLSR